MSTTAALYHACSSHLDHLDRIQRRFLRELGVSELEALMEFNLAPLSSRRDMAMMGLIHRTVLRQGPESFEQFFRLSTQPPSCHRTRAATRRHSRQLQDIRSGSFLEIERRSALGLASVYNLLPEHVVKALSVLCFQSFLQGILRERACNGFEDWHDTFSPRIEMYRHPLN